jgi:hypothetical protein
LYDSAWQASGTTIGARGHPRADAASQNTETDPRCAD